MESLPIVRRCFETPLWKEAYFRKRNEDDVLFHEIEARSTEYDLREDSENPEGRRNFEARLDGPGWDSS